MSPRILFVIHRLSYGGASKIMAFLANQLSYEDYDVHLFAYESNETVPSLAPSVHHVACRYSPCAVVGLRRIVQITQIREVIYEVKPDVIISFLAYPNVMSIIASRGMSTRVIICERGDPFSERGWFSRFRDFVYRFADGYVFQTNGARQYYSKRIQTQAAVVPNPVIAEDISVNWRGGREDAIITAGRLELKQKRQDLLISAFSRIAANHPHIRLVIYGDGEDETAIRQLVSNLRLEGRVVLAGVSRNMLGVMKNARMFVLSSDYEGIPNALVEAMSIGVPCISTDCSPGGAAQLIRNMENGILVPRGCRDELANAMEFMLTNPERAELMGRNARLVTRDLDPDAIVDRWKSYIARYTSSYSARI